MGLMKFSQVGWNKIERFLNKLDKKEIDKMDMTQLFKKLLDENFNRKNFLHQSMGHQNAFPINLTNSGS